MTSPKAFALPAILAICLSGVGPAWAQATEESPPKEKPGSTVVSQPPPENRPPNATLKQPAVRHTRESESRWSRDRPLVEFEIVCEDQFWGTIVLELHRQAARATVHNFLRYVDEGFYDGTIFHRTLPDFLIQGGGYVAVGKKKTVGLRRAIRNESQRSELKNQRGTIAMARRGNPHSAVSQFFINVRNNEQLDYPQAGSYGYCAFGRVIEGMEVVDRIRNVPTQVSPAAQRRFQRYKEEGQAVKRAEKSQPLRPPTIRKARRLDRAEYEQRVAHRAGAAPATTMPAVPPEAGVATPVVRLGQPEVPASQPAVGPEPQEGPEDRPEDEPEDEPSDEPERPDEPEGSQ